jgi:hypothetical protein
VDDITLAQNNTVMNNNLNLDGDFWNAQDGVATGGGHRISQYALTGLVIFCMARREQNYLYAFYKALGFMNELKPHLYHAGGSPYRLANTVYHFDLYRLSMKRMGTAGFEEC